MELAEENLATAEVDNNSWQQLWWIFWMFCVQRRAKTVMSMCRAQTLNCGSNFTNCQDYVGVIGISEEDVIFFTWQLLDISTFLFPNEEQRKTSPWQIEAIFIYFNPVLIWIWMLNIKMFESAAGGWLQCHFVLSVGWLLVAVHITW